MVLIRVVSPFPLFVREKGIRMKFETPNRFLFIEPRSPVEHVFSRARIPRLGTILLGTLLSLTSWFVWAFLIYFIGTRFLPESGTVADYGQLLRTIGFSSSPGIAHVLGVIPDTTQAVFLVVSVWTLVAMVVAVRVALSYSSSLRAATVCILGWLVQFLVFLLFSAFSGGPPAGAL